MRDCFGKLFKLVASQARERFKLRVRELTRTGRHLALAHLVNRLRLFLTGWRAGGVISAF